MMPRKKKCPVCLVLRGEQPGKGALCRDCTGNKQLRDTWSEYNLIAMMAQTNWIYRFLLPILLICGHGILFFKDGDAFKYGTGVACFVAWAVYFFNLFYLWPKYELRLADMRERKRAVFDKLFVIKVAGDRRVSGTYSAPAR